MNNYISLEMDVLNAKAKEKGSSAKILDSYKNINYADGEQFKFIEKLKNLIDIIDDRISKSNIEFDKNFSLEYIKSGLDNMYDILSNNKSYTSAPKDYDERKEFFDRIAKALSFLTDNFEKKYQGKEIDDLQGYFALESIGDAGFYCAGRWRELIEKLTIQLDTKDQQKLGIKINPENYLEEKLRDTYENARNIEIERLAQKFRNIFYKLQGVSMETHYKSFFKRYLSEKYNLTSTTIQDDDTLFSSKNIGIMKLKAENFLNYVNVDFLINERAKKIFEGEDLNKNTQMRDAIYEWGIQRYKTLSESEKNKYDDLVHYVNSNVFNIDDDYVIKGLRKGVVDSLVKDKGFVSTMTRSISEISLTDNLLKKIRLKFESDVLHTLNTVELGESNLNKIFIAAVESGSLKLVARTIEKGADPNLTYERYKTPLVTAIRWGNLEMVNKLLEYDSNPNLVNCFGEAPLSYAAMQNKPEIARKLIEKGAKTTFRNRYGDTALYYAAARDSTEMLKIILDNMKSLYKPEKSNRGGVIMTNLKSINNIVRKSNFEEGNRCLKIACTKGSYNAVRELIKNNNDKIHIRQSLIHKTICDAIIKNNIYLLKAVIESGFDLNGKIDYKNTPLELAIKAPPTNKQKRIIEMLIDNGASLDRRNKNGDTPLMVAIKVENYELATQLFNAGADFTLKNNWGISALDLAKKSNYTPLFMAMNEKINSSNFNRNMSEAGERINSLTGIRMTRNTERENRRNTGREFN
jgi:ankyrin repeat protein